MGGRGGASHRKSGNGGGTLPKSLANFMGHEQNWMNRYFSPFFTAEQMRYMQGQLQRVFAQNDFGMDINARYLENVIQEGFKNQFQTHSSNGALDFDMRKQVAENLFGLNARSLKAADFERYGYLVTSDVTQHNASGYGDVTIRFKKSNLIDRTTYTIDDSLGPGLSDDLIAGSVKRGSLTGIFYPHNASEAKNLYAQFKAAEAYTSSPREWARIIERGSAYLELQYHGSLTIGDVSSMNFKMARPSDALLSELKRRGIAVYYQGNKL